LRIRKELGDHVILVAVSKMKTVADILALYEMGQRDFGENYVQELLMKQPMLPGDIRWHFIGHLQTNKVKLIAPFIFLVHSVDSLKLYKELHKEGIRNNRDIECLAQVHIAREESKFGLDTQELKRLLEEVSGMERAAANPGVVIKGLMGMASFTEDQLILQQEFKSLRDLFQDYSSKKSASISFTHLSMGMSSDYALAVKFGSNMVRIGSLLFGMRS